MKTKIKDLVASNGALIKLFDKGKTKNIKLLYRLMFLKKNIADQSDEKSAYSQTRAKSLAEHFKDQTTGEYMGETVEEKKDHHQKFMNEMEELGENEVEINVDLFKMEDLESIALDDPLTPTELFSLFWLLDLSGSTEESKTE